jgi:hypothetical protein
MGRQRREQRTAIDEEGPSRERISDVRAMGRPAPIARSTLIYALDSALPRRWASAAPFAAFPSYALR